MNIRKTIVQAAAVAFIFAGCKGSKDKSSTTGWGYNDPKWGGFEVADDKGQITGPNLVFIEGGTFAMGITEQDVTYEYNNIPRKVSVNSFYMDETEVANVHYREYIYWTERVFGAEHPEILRSVLPDTLCWRDELAYNEPYVEYYLRHPSYNYYPVVGVTWLQATEYCKWRSDRVNEMLLVKNQYLEMNTSQVNEENFNTDAYLAGQYQGTAKKMKEDLNPNGSGQRNVNMSDGIMLPDYRLPTEAEWEFAALALKGTVPVEGEELVTNRRIYPWDGSTLRYQKHTKTQGDFLANFKRGDGDYAGVAGALNDNAMITADVYSNMPNDFGLFNMAGNVSEWVEDVYRPLTLADFQDLNPYRGNVFMKPVLNEDGTLAPKDSMGRIKYEVQPQEEIGERRNYRSAYAKDYIDGDSASEVSYNYGVSSLVSDKARVYKGGSWNDRAFWLSPGSRRFLNEDQSSNQIGFRCAMDRMGSASTSMNGKSGNQFKESKKISAKNAKSRK